MLPAENSGSQARRKKKNSERFFRGTVILVWDFVLGFGVLGSGEGGVPLHAHIKYLTFFFRYEENIGY